MIVTVVTPTLNAMEFLPECIDSAQRNNSPDVQVEHVIVDGGSTDGTVEYAQSRGLQVMTGKDRGIFDAINKGSFNSSGELLGFLGADDVLLDGGLDAIVRTYRGTRARWMVGGIQWIDDRGSSLGGLSAPPAWVTAKMAACLYWSPMMHIATYFTRDFYTELGGFDIEYKVSGDLEMFTRALTKAPFARVNARIAAFRRTGQNTSAVQSERGHQEDTKIMHTFGPGSGAERALWRYALKTYFNIRNPGWLGLKVASRARYRLGFQEKSYF